jgi:hypothetical protein
MKLGKEDLTFAKFTLHCHLATNYLPNFSYSVFPAVERILEDFRGNIYYVVCPPFTLNYYAAVWNLNLYHLVT